MEWWIYVVVIGGIIVVYFTSALIIRALMVKAQKKCNALLEKITPIERARFDKIVEVKLAMENDGRHLPKNMVETTLDQEREFSQIPVDIQKVKSVDDFLILYYIKYLKEKNLKIKYQQQLETLEAIIYSKPEDKDYPYYEYNKAALKYNSYLNMGFLNPFRAGREMAPTL